MSHDPENNPMKNKTLKTQAQRPVRVVGSGRLVRHAWAIKSKQWWKGGFTEYRVFIGKKADLQYIKSLCSSFKAVRVSIRELRMSNKADITTCTPKE
jgi:hypothetical protein